MTVLAPTGTAGPFTTAATVAGRTARKLLRSPQILGIAVVQSVLFLLMFRYVIGGAIGVEGVSYVNFLVPGFVVSGMLFTAGGGAVGVAEDAATGLYDRLRSLPISGVAVLAGRAVADAALMLGVGLVTIAVGFAVGFRLGGRITVLPAALGLLVVYSVAFACVFVLLGLVSGSGQAAQGLGISASPSPSCPAPSSPSPPCPQRCASSPTPNPSPSWSTPGAAWSWASPSPGPSTTACRTTSSAHCCGPSPSPSSPLPWRCGPTGDADRSPHRATGPGHHLGSTRASKRRPRWATWTMVPLLERALSFAERQHCHSPVVLHGGWR